MAQAAKNTVDTSLKDKLKLAHALMLLFSFIVGQIEFSTFTRVPITKVAIIFYIGAMILVAFYEDHRHKERTGHYPKGVDIVDEMIKWAKKVCEAEGVDLEARLEKQGEEKKKEIMNY